MLLEEIDGLTFDGIAIAVGHQLFSEMGAETVIRMCEVPSCIFDVKEFLGSNSVFKGCNLKLTVSWGLCSFD